MTEQEGSLDDGNTLNLDGINAKIMAMELLCKFARSY